MQAWLNDQFILDLVSGDSSAFRQLYKHYFRRLPSFIARLFPYLKNDALDLTQVTLVKIHRNLWRFNGWKQAQIDSYIHRAAFRQAFNLSKNKVRRGEISIEDMQAALKDPATSGQSVGIKVSSFLTKLITGDSETRRIESMRIKCALKQLKRAEREIILSIDMMGITHQDLAALKNVSKAAISKRHQRARKRFIAFYQIC